jgi:hypothetical protein
LFRSEIANRMKFLARRARRDTISPHS